MAKNPLDLSGNGKMDMGDLVAFVLALIFGILGLMIGQMLGIVADMELMAQAYIVVFVGIGGILGGYVKKALKIK